MFKDGHACEPCVLFETSSPTLKLPGCSAKIVNFYVISGTREDEVEKMKNQLSSKGYTSWKTQFGAAGVTLHFNMTSLDI